MVTKKYDSFFKSFNNMIMDELEEFITLYYPEKREECPNCYIDTFAGIMKTVSKYKNNGPMPFTNGMPCPYCDGNGYKSIEQKENIPGRIYTENKNYQTFKNLNLSSGQILFVCRIDFFTKILMSKYMRPVTEIHDLTIEKYELVGQPEHTGFTINPVKYITSIWKKVL